MTPEPSAPRTPDEDRAEWEHIYDTRVAIRCGTQPPTPAIHREAIQEADAHLARLKAVPPPAGR